MQDEKGYRAHIVDYEDAMEKLGGVQHVDGIVVQKAYELWRLTVKYEREKQKGRETKADVALEGHNLGRGPGGAAHAQ